MKSIISLALFAILSVAAFAAVEINDTGNVYVDGVNVGAPADAIANNPALAPQIQTALVAFVAQTKQTADAAVATAQSSVAAKEAEKQTAIAAANTARDAAIAANAAELAETKSQLAANTTALEAAQAQIAQLQQQLADLTPPPQ